MKKLMIATATLCAAVGASALESANTVGYQDIPLNDDGFSIVGASFINVGATGANTGLHVTDIKIKGYLDHEGFQDAGTDGDFTMMIIDKDGRGVHSYSYTHEWDWDTGAWAAAGGKWYDAEAGDFVTVGGALDIVIPAGQGLFFSAPTFDDGDTTAGNTFVVGNSGEVYQQTVPFIVNDDGFTCIANPYPAGVKVSTVKVSGYLDHEGFQDAGTDGDFTMMVIDKNGHGIHSYSYTHEWDWDTGAWAAAGGKWYDAEAGDFVVADGALDYALPGGQGLFISAPTYDDGDTTASAEFTFTFYYPAN